jgi:hypothetical protein
MNQSSEVFGKLFNWHNDIAYATEKRYMDRFSMWTLRTVFNICSAKPNQSALWALKKSTVLGLLS